MDEDFVLHVLKEIKLEIGKDRIPGVTAQLQRIAEIAQRLDEVELDPFADEMAPVWRP
jgi:Asp-tRNA(Asn)/Glu-tRNA(Gln) amidotransferase C subunit